MSKMIVGIIAARMASTRLPGKVMLTICGKTILEHMVDRVTHSRTLDKVLIATSTDESDDVIEALCRRTGIECIRGPNEDLLSRYKMVCDAVGADIIAKMGADSPLIDPSIIDKVVKIFVNNDYDYVSNYGPFPRTYPEGIALDVYTSKTLDEVYNEAKKPSEREHISPFIWMRPERYRIYRVDCEKDLLKYRLCLDYKEDYYVIKSVFEGLYPQNPFFTMEEIIEWLDAHPDILKINSHIKPYEGLLKSLEQDKLGSY